MCRNTLMVFPVAVAFLMSSPPGGGQIKLSATKADAIKKDLKRMAGTWKLDFKVVNGTPVNLETQERREGPAFRILVLGEDGSAGGVSKSKTPTRFRNRIDPTTRRKSLDLVFLNEMGEEQKVNVGIYEIEDDKLTLCYTAAVNPRPTDFTCQRGSGHVLAIYRRVKDKK
jgi:uncharacterized protein (TIGR03067 family)